MSTGTTSMEAEEYVTITVDDQLFGLPIARVRDVFMVGAVTPVPLAPSEIIGLLNLRGRVITVVCLRRCLGLPLLARQREAMAVGLDQNGESYGLLVDGVGEVLPLSSQTLERNPIHLLAQWARLSRGVHRLEGKLLILLDIDAVLLFEENAQAA